MHDGGGWVRIVAQGAALVVLFAGCGADPRQAHSSPGAHAAPAARAAPTARAAPIGGGAVRVYSPSAHHAHRPAHSIYNDEIGENIVGLRTPYRRVVQLFGTPLARRRQPQGVCAFYPIVGQPPTGWDFCFRQGRMESGAAVDRNQFFKSPVGG